MKTSRIHTSKKTEKGRNEPHEAARDRGCHDDDRIILLPVEEIRAFTLARATSYLNAWAAGLFAEALHETKWWSGEPVKVSIEHGLILRYACKAVVGIWAGADFIPVVDLPFPDREAAEAYAARFEFGPQHWHREHPAEEAVPLEEISWVVRRPDGEEPPNRIDDFCDLGSFLFGRD